MSILTDSAHGCLFVVAGNVFSFLCFDVLTVERIDPLLDLYFKH
jgi:hypothetical protein